MANAALNQGLKLSKPSLSPAIKHNVSVLVPRMLRLPRRCCSKLVGSAAFLGARCAPEGEVWAEGKRAGPANPNTSARKLGGDALKRIDSIFSLFQNLRTALAAWLLPSTEWPRVRFPGRAHAQDAGLVPDWGTYGRQPTHVSRSHRCLSLSLALSEVNKNVSSGEA